MSQPKRSPPEWFVLGEEATPQVMACVANLVAANNLTLQVRTAPMLAHWFLLDSLLLANRANRDGMHANALSITRQCLEAMTVVELGVCGHTESEAMLLSWERDELTAGKLRAWLEHHVWPQYGSGLWAEPWATFMREFARALQPYAHYGPQLSQWQVRLVPGTCGTESTGPATAVIEVRPRAYDAQKGTRITLFHAVLTYALGRVCVARGSARDDLAALIARLGSALGKSRYLDGHETDWSRQLWAMLWSADGRTILE